MQAGRAQSPRPIRKRFRCAELLLPVILFRALIPTGFMPAIDADGGFSMTFCSGTVVGQDAGAAHHHGHHGGTGEAGESGHQQLACPFAASAGLAPLPEISIAVAGPVDAPAPESGHAAHRFIPSIIRAQSPRAPPGVA